MKALYRLFTLVLALACAAPLYANATTPHDDSLRLALDHVFAPLDKAQIPAPYLQEYGYKFASLEPFNGTLTDSCRTTLSLWRQLYISLLSGSINGPNYLPDPGTLNQELSAQLAATSAIPLLIQRVNYAALRPDAVTAGLLSESNGQLYDVAGRPESPYLRRTLFAVAPGRSTARTGEVSFLFKPTLHAQSGGGSVTSLSVDFSDGRGYVAATWDQPVSASYCTAGTRRVKVRVSYSNQVQSITRALPQPHVITYESHFDLEVLGEDCVAGRYDDPELVQVFAPQPGVHSGGRVHVRFGAGRNNMSQITRPLIVAEGYDGHSVAPSVYEENYGIENFMRSIRANGFFVNGNLASFSAQLEDAGDPGAPAPQGYDIVFIDYNNGTDDIRRNAALFEEVVNWVNSVKTGGTASGQQNVVLGISMGGLVARYGLAEMEKAQSGSTHTRLLLTHDSPHRGANTPLGLQALTRQAAATVVGSLIRTYNNFGIITYLPAYQVFPEIDEADKLLDAPATRQLLLVRATRSGYSPFASFGHEFNSFLDNEYRAMIMPNAGQTFPYSFVASSLGSECGQELFAPHAELVRVAGKGFLSALVVSTAFHTEIIVNALPQGGQIERLSSLRLWNQVRILGIRLPRIYFSNFSFHSPAGNPFPWDGLPGGTQAIRSRVPLEPADRGGWWYIYNFGTGYNWGVRLVDDFCFVPRASALDVAVLDNASLRGRYTNGTSAGSAPQPLRFLAQARFIDPAGVTKFNEQHPRFPARQAQWLFNEMQLQPQPAAVACSNECLPPLVITGPAGVCGAATYSVPTFAGATYTWTTSPAGAFSPATGTGSTFTTTAIGPAGAQVFVSVASPCVNFNTSIPVAVCAPLEVAFTNIVYTNACLSGSGRPNLAQFTAQATGGTAPYTYAWYADYSNSNTYPSQPSGTGAIFGLCMNGYSLVTVKVVATDATGQTASLLYYGQNQGRGTADTMYPNPADGYVEVANQTPEAGESQQRGAAPEPMQVTVYNGQGLVVLDVPTTTAAVLRLDTRTWQPGFYQVVIRHGKTQTRRQLSVQH